MKIKNIIKNKGSKGIIVIVEKSNYGFKFNERMKFNSMKHFNDWKKLNKARRKRRKERKLKIKKYENKTHI